MEKHIHLKILKEVVNVDAEGFVVGQPGETANIETTARIRVHLGEAGSLISPPAVRHGGRRRLFTAGRTIHALLGTLACRLDYAGLDLDRTTKHVKAIQFDHGPIGELFCWQIDKTVGRVAAGKRVNRNIDTLANGNTQSGLFKDTELHHSYMENSPAVNRASTSSDLAV